MNHLTEEQKKRVVTEFSSLEEKLDLVLFARNDDDDDFPYVKTGIATAGTAGVGYGGYKAWERGRSVNSVTGAIGPVKPKGLFRNLGAGIKSYASSSGNAIIGSEGIRNLRAFLKGGVRKVAKAI